MSSRLVHQSMTGPRHECNPINSRVSLRSCYPRVPPCVIGRSALTRWRVRRRFRWSREVLAEKSRGTTL